ncbi:MAG: Wzy polymerase domain-containing protein [Burkholderiales bacterium]
MLTGLSLTFIALLGLLPYISTIKLPPIPSFWAEWVAVVLVIGCIVSLRKRVERPIAGSATRPVAVPVVVLAFGALAAALLLQLLLGQPMFRGAPLLTLLALVLATLVCLAGTRVREAGEATRLLDVWSIGLLIALVLNLLAVLGEREGLHLYIYQLGTRTPPLRAEGLIGQPNQLAVFAGLASVAAHYLWMRGKLSSIGHVLVSLVAGILIAASASRAGALLWILGAALSALALREHPLRRQGWRLLVVGTALFFAAQVGWKLLQSHAAVNISVLRSDSLGRIELLRDSWALIRLHPWSGVGYGNFMGARWAELSTSLFEPAANHAHNLVAELLAELGVIPGALVLIPLGWALWNCVRVVTRRGVAAEQFLAASAALLLAGYSLVEYPLWYTFFMLPFALLLGLVEQHDLTLRLSPAPRLLRGIGWAIALAICVGLAFDYHRSEELYSNLELQQRESKGGVVRIPLEEARRVSALSAFDMYANLMYSRAMAPDGLFMGYKVEIAERATMGMTNQETIARQVALLVVASDLDAARVLLARTHRNPDLERSTRDILSRLSPLHPALGAFVKALPALPAASSVTLGQ